MGKKERNMYNQFSDDEFNEALLCAALEKEINRLTQADKDAIRSIGKRFFGFEVQDATIANATITGFYMGLNAGFNICEALYDGINLRQDENNSEER